MTPMDEILQLVQQMPQKKGYPFHMANRSSLVNYERIAIETASLAGYRTMEMKFIRKA